jgi:hypothetical protein
MSPDPGLETSVRPSGVTARNRALDTRENTLIENPLGIVRDRVTLKGAVAKAGATWTGTVTY